MHCSLELKIKILFYHPASIILFHRFHLLISFSLFYPCLSLSLSLIHCHLLSETEAHFSPFTLSTPVQSLHSLFQLRSLRPTPPNPHVTEAQLRSLRPTPPKPNVSSTPVPQTHAVEAQRHRSSTPVSQLPSKLNSGPSTFG